MHNTTAISVRKPTTAPPWLTGIGVHVPPLPPDRTPSSRTLVSLGFGLKPRDRRRAVLVLRIRGRSQKAIGQLLRISQPTVARDLAYWRRHGAHELPHEEDPAIAVGEALTFYDLILSLALAEYDVLAANCGSVTSAVPALMACLKVALLATNARVRLLRDVGLLTRYPFDNSRYGPSANDVRARLVAAGVIGGRIEGSPSSESGTEGQRLTPTRSS